MRVNRFGPVFASARRPGPLAMPVRQGVTAFTDLPAFERWNAGVKALATGDNVITMYNPIGDDPWTGEGVTAKRVSAQLRAIGERPVEVHLNSPGGDMFEGIAVYNLLREHPQPVTIKIMGVAASAASVIAMAADTLQIGAASFLMIHNAWVIAAGNRHDMRETADFLEPFDTAMAGVYSQRSGAPLADVKKWMDAERWFNGDEAVALGLADEILPADAITEDTEATANARAVNDVRAVELSLVRAGLTRSEARARIKNIKGTPGAAIDSGTPGAAETEWLAQAASLASILRK